MQAQINIDLDLKSNNLMTSLVQSILDLLLHERAQIPFPFEVFEKFITNKTNKTECSKIKHYKELNQINLAKETYDKICSFKQVRK